MYMYSSSSAQLFLPKRRFHPLSIGPFLPIYGGQDYAFECRMWIVPVGRQASSAILCPTIELYARQTAGRQERYASAK